MDDGAGERRADPFDVELLYTRSEWLLIGADGAPRRGAYRARLAGAWAQGADVTPEAALEDLAAGLRRWVEEWGIEPDENEAAFSRRERGDESAGPKLVGRLRRELREGTLGESLRAAAGEAIVEPSEDPADS